MAMFTVAVINPPAGGGSLNSTQYAITLTNPCIHKGQNFLVSSDPTNSGNYSVNWSYLENNDLPYDEIKFTFELITPGYTFVSPGFTDKSGGASTGLTFGSPTIVNGNLNSTVTAEVAAQGSGTYNYSLNFQNAAGVQFSIDPAGAVDISTGNP
jgi:hypothetical protein